MTQVAGLALELIAAVRAALGSGTRHYALDGRLLATDLEIIEALTVDGTITIEPVTSARPESKGRP
jgi:hypothetical protein